MKPLTKSQTWELRGFNRGESRSFDRRLDVARHLVKRGLIERDPLRPRWFFRLTGHGAGAGGALGLVDFLEALRASRPMLRVVAA